jgi:hypothetical protein
LPLVGICAQCSRLSITVSDVKRVCDDDDGDDDQEDLTRRVRRFRVGCRQWLDRVNLSTVVQAARSTDARRIRDCGARVMDPSRSPENSQVGRAGHRARDERSGAGDIDGRFGAGVSV